MFNLLITIFFLLIVQKNVSSFGHFGHFDLKSYSDPRFLNSDYHFKGLGLFHPNSKGFETFGSFGDSRKETNADDFFAKHDISKEDVEHKKSGGFKGEEGSKGANGEYGYFFDSDGGKKESVDGKEYYGKDYFGTEEKSGGKKEEKQGHRKGHKIKGFSTSHHNDESGKSEEFYDEEHDEADDEEFTGKSGAFGENSSSSFKGGHEDGGFKIGEVKKEVTFDKGENVKKVQEDEGHFGETKFGEKGVLIGGEKGIGEGILSKFTDNSNFEKHHPSINF